MKDNRVLLAKDIEDIYGKVVNTYLEKGYSINVGTMSGSSGELAKIDVTNGKDVYRIALFSNMWSETKEGRLYFSGNKVVLSVEKFEGCANSKRLRGCNTLWNGKGKTICSTEWYELGYNKASAYTNSLEYACKCQTLGYKRNHARSGNRWDNTTVKSLDLSDKQRAIVADMCRRTRGYKRIKDGDIERLDVNTYTNGEKTFRVYFINGMEGLTIGRIRR